jgi:hypothetical protein
MNAGMCIGFNNFFHPCGVIADEGVVPLVVWPHRCKLREFQISCERKGFWIEGT